MLLDTSKVPWADPRVIPRFVAIVTSSVEMSFPPSIVSCPEVTEPGTAPRLVSAEIEIEPALIVVVPL